LTAFIDYSYDRELMVKFPVCSTDELRRGCYLVVLYNGYVNTHGLVSLC